jgi:hypothetical protein
MLHRKGHPCLPPYHLGPTQLNLYELANRNQNVAYSEQKGPDRLYRTTQMYDKLPKRA